MKIALSQINYHIGNFDSNFEKISVDIQKAKNDKADIIVFSELSVCAYPPGDLLGFSTFIDATQQIVQRISALAQGIAVVIGAPEKNPDKKGKPLFNAAFFLADGQIKAVIHKALLPDYDVFDEFRYFEPAVTFDVVSFKGKKIALTICEDLWNINNEGLYHHCPMDVLKSKGADFIINIAASPFDYSQPQKRLDILKANVRKYNIPLIYVNQVGAHASLIFDGGSMALDANGEIIACCKFFKEDYAIVQLSDTPLPSQSYAYEHIAMIHDALVLGIKDYFSKSGIKKAILGLSGGIDSAVTLVLAVRALGKENVKSILMPSEFSSDHSVNDAIALAENLDTPYEILKISEVYNAANNTLAPLFTDKPFDITEENLQARIRALFLMACSNKLGNVLLNTSNKSEAAVGYGTLYGDMCGALSVIGDLYKTQVFELAKYINRVTEIIPENTITKPPSAELRFDQKDSDSLPDYDVLDKVLFEYIENELTKSQIVKMGYDEALVSRIIKLVNFNEFKRFQCPPILRISPKAFGSGRQIPLVARFDWA